MLYPTYVQQLQRVNLHETSLAEAHEAVGCLESRAPKLTLDKP